MGKSAEFILEYESKQVLVLEPFGPYYEDVVKRLAEQPDLQVVECESIKEWALTGRQVGVCVMFGHCPSAAEASFFVHLLEACRTEIKARRIRVILTVSKDFIALQPRFIREGANEVIQQPISPKLLYRKIDRYITILPSRDKYGKVIPPRPRAAGSGDDLSDEPVVTWRQALDLQSDCWMAIEGKSRWNPSAKKWSLSIIGPPPQYGEWSKGSAIPEQPVPQPAEQTWEWIPNDLTNDPFIREEGAWKFRGEKPEFKEGAWNFKAHNPKLAFVREDENKGAKVEGVGIELAMTENSQQAMKASELIETSLRENRKVTVQEILDSLNGSVRQDDDIMDSAIDDTRPTPEYLRRVELKEEDPANLVSKSHGVNLLMAALLVAEMIQSKTFSPQEMLQKFCAYLDQASGGTVVEIWRFTSSGWKCVQHDDLMDMALQQKLESVTYDKHVRSGIQRGYLIERDAIRLGALVIRCQSDESFTDLELEGLSKAVVGILAGMHSDIEAA